MTCFLLVSGAWHGGWCWERVVPLLEARGHTVLAPDLLGMGEDTSPLAALTLRDWAEQVAELARAQSEPVILVGHSRGGIVISEAAERVPEHVATLVYLAAFLLPSGESIMSASAKVKRPHQADMLVTTPEGTATLVPERIGPQFYNTTEPYWIARAVSHVGPEPLAMLTTTVAITDERYGSAPRVYIECEQDQAVPLALQRQMQAILPCELVLTLPGDHSPFYSDPEALAKCLEQVVLKMDG